MPLARLISFSVSFVVTMTLVATLLARAVSHFPGAPAPAVPQLSEREHDQTLARRIGGTRETDGSRAPEPRHQAVRARLP
jgi:hypothetical protein